jgi:hypothetical protein
MHERHVYVSVYRERSDDELDRLLEQIDDLEEGARVALLAEVKLRGRAEAEISRLITAGRGRRQPLKSIGGSDGVLTDRLGNLRRIKGTGRAFLGRSNAEHNDAHNFEEFDTTLWWTIVWVPFVPRDSFRIRLRQANPEAPRFARGASEFAVVRRLPFLWRSNIIWLLLAGILLWYPLGAVLIARLFGRH